MGSCGREGCGGTGRRPRGAGGPGRGCRMDGCSTPVPLRALPPHSCRAEGKVTTEGNRKAAGSNGLCISKNQPDPDEKHLRKKKNTDMALGTGQNFEVWCKEMWTGKLG